MEAGKKGGKGDEKMGVSLLGVERLQQAKGGLQAGRERHCSPAVKTTLIRAGVAAAEHHSIRLAADLAGDLAEVGRVGNVGQVAAQAAVRRAAAMAHCHAQVNRRPLSICTKTGNRATEDNVQR